MAALLGGYLLFVVLRETTAVTRGSLVGLPAETLAAGAAFVIGYGTNGLGSVPLGPAAASATGFALAVIADRARSSAAPTSSGSAWRWPSWSPAPSSSGSGWPARRRRSSS